MLQEIKVAEHMKKVVVIDELVYTRNIDDNVAPFKAAKSMKRDVAVEAAIFPILALIKKTRANSPIIKPKNTSLFPNIKFWIETSVET
jgi:hypothetical protein